MTCGLGFWVQGGGCFVGSEKVQVKLRVWGLKDFRA